MRKIISFCVLMGLMAFSISTFANTNPLKIGVSLATLREERWSRERDLLQQYAQKKGVKLIFQVADNDESVQNRQIENLVTQKVDALIIMPQNRKSVIPAVKMAKAEKIPVIAYDRFIPSQDVDVYISFDNEKVGEAQAKALLKLKPEGNYLWLGGDPSDDNAHQIRRGHMKVLRPHIDSGKIKLITEQWCQQWSPQEALKHTENALTAHQNKIDAILASNDGTAGGAIQGLASQNLQGKVPVTGQDAELAAVQRVALGTQAITILKDVRTLSQSAIDLAIQLGNKEKNLTITNKMEGVSSVLLDVVTVTQDNFEQTIIASGFHSKRDVFRALRRRSR